MYDLYVCTDLTFSELQKSLDLLLKIGPIGVLKFGGVGKMSYLCSVKNERRALRLQTRANAAQLKCKLGTLKCAI